MHHVAYAYGWAKRAVAEAVHGLEMYATVGGGLSERNAKHAPGVLSQSAASDRLARFSLTELYDRTPDRRFPKVTVESDDAMHFGAREIERVRRVADGGGRDVAESMLHAMQER